MNEPTNPTTELPAEFRVLVCGGRDYSDRATMFTHLDYIRELKPITLIIHGGAQGADSLAGAYGRERGIPVKVFQANWKDHGKGAGPRRNQLMLDEGKPHLVIGFPGGRGTADMMQKARAAGVKVVKVEAQ